MQANTRTDSDRAPSPATAASPSAQLPREIDDSRLVSLDVLRGLAVAGMILVTDPGTYSAVYPQLLHALWNGATAADMIFPTFLVAVGVAITLSFDVRIQRGSSRAQLALHALVRSMFLFVIGLAANGFPDYNLATLRIPGVLQRIALCYMTCGLVYLWLSEGQERKAVSRKVWTIVATVFVLLAGYWAALKLIPVPGFGPNRLDSLGNLGAYIDRAVFGIPHMWAWGLTPGYGVTYDPEGLLSTLGAIATTFIGILAGEWLRSEFSGTRKAIGLAVVGLALALAGLLLHPLLPINKRIWTSTFTLFSGGVALILFAALYFLLDVKRWRWWTPPALVFGTNAILAFALSSVITVLSDRIHMPSQNGPALTLHQWGNQVLEAWLQPVHASLAYAIVVTAINLAMLYPFYRRRFFLRV
jgi:predicted acyltransferase